MTDGALLHVVSCTLHAQTQIDHLLRALRRMQPADTPFSYTLLLFCDLADAQAVSLPQDAPMLRRLQSGVMAINARSGCKTALLVRRRAWDDAQRAYLGASQKTSCREVVARLLRGEQADAHFDAATLSPASIKGRFSLVLFSDIALASAPDIPARMARALADAPSGCVCARTAEKRAFPQTALTRLCTGCSFSLSPLLTAREDHLLRRGFGLPPLPAMYAAGALCACAAQQEEAPLAPECFFVRRQARTLADFFSDFRQRCLHGPLLTALLPISSLLLLAAAALLGLPWLAALAVLAPEIWALLHPRLLPGALLRLAVLPLSALVSLDTLLCRALARSKLLRLRVPDNLVTPQGCALFGAALLPAALYGAQALAPLLPVCLLWLAAPLIIPALDLPTIERIPLSDAQTAELRTLSESAYWEIPAHACAPKRLLAACAGCMLGLLEPDEAARQAAAVLREIGDAPLPPEDHAALLCAAQMLRERMGDCDAALRGLPAEMEARALSLPLERTGGPLWALLCAARGEEAPPSKPAEDGRPLDALFLPLRSARDSARHALTLPLTHPHTFLKRQLLSPDVKAPQSMAAERFLSLAAAALEHPFCALLERSPVTGPYWPLLTI